MSADAPRRLGRGLEALLSTARQQRDHAVPDAFEAGLYSLRSIPIGDIAPNQFQPRRTFVESDLVELESSMKTSGLLQPITVRGQPRGGWELVAGERRLKAATRLGWTEISAIVREFDDRTMLTLALVENLQRADLNAIEEAEGYRRLIVDFQLTQQQVADAVGKDRTSITNLLRVLTLPVAIQGMVQQGQLTTGHARALLSVKNHQRQIELANEAVARQLTVREVESRARTHLTESSSQVQRRKTSIGTPISSDPSVRDVENILRKRLQTDVSIRRSGKEGGTMSVSFYSHDDLNRLLDLILGRHRSDFD